MAIELDARKWARQQFSGAKLGDRRRVRRLVQLGRHMACRPGVSLCKLGKTPYDVKAIYNLLRHPESTPDNLQAGHRKRVLKAISQGSGVVLLAEDTSELSWFTSREIEGLGPVGKTHAKSKGFHLHSVLALRWAMPFDPKGPYRHPAVEVLGLADQIYYTRKPVPEGEDPDDSFARKNRARESQLWTDATKRLGAVPQGVRRVRVCDRAADIYEFLVGCKDLGYGYVVRAAQDRVLADSKARLFQRVRALKPWAKFELKVRERPQKRQAHTAKLAISACRVEIQSPQRPGAGRGKLPPVVCYAVHVWELDTPKGSEPLEWILLTDAVVETPDQALEVALQYSTRWVIEDFHKALKSGMGAERLQLADAHSLFAAISVMSIDALRLLDLRERLRVNPDAPAAESGLDALELKILRIQTKRKLSTVRDVALALGRMGGHMNRKADGMPGMVTLWRGYHELKMLTAGAHIAHQLRGTG